MVIRHAAAAPVVTYHASAAPTTTNRPEIPANAVSQNQDTSYVSFPSDTARITVRLPASAKLFVDDVLCPLTSDTRSFNTPKLEAGRKYYYTLRMEQEQNGTTQVESRRVIITPGEHVQVDFRIPAAVKTVRR